MEAVDQWMLVRVGRQHGEAEYLAAGLAKLGAPQACEGERRLILQSDLPAD